MIIRWTCSGRSLIALNTKTLSTGIRMVQVCKIDTVCNAVCVFGTIMDVSTQTDEGGIETHMLSRHMRGVEIEDSPLDETFSDDDGSDQNWYDILHVICSDVFVKDNFGYILQCRACHCKPAGYDSDSMHQSVSCQTDYCESLNDYYERQIAHFEKDQQRLQACFRQALSDLTTTLNCRYI